ncbi:unnamed protein product [Malus baccata var. baccata]
MRVLLVKADDSTRHIIVVLLRNVATKAKLNRHHMCRSRIKGWFSNGVFSDLISLSSVTRLVVILVSWLGLCEYKHDGSKARELEEAIGIKLCRFDEIEIEIEGERVWKSCRLRWTNHLRPDLKRGLLSEYEEKICEMTRWVSVMRIS